MTEAARIKIDACKLLLGDCCASCHDDDEYGYELSVQRRGNLDITACCYVFEKTDKMTEAEILELWKTHNDK